MQIRFSPYNSPFAPASIAGVYWIGREHSFIPHSAHVLAFRTQPVRLVTHYDTEVHRMRRLRAANENYTPEQRNKLISSFFDSKNSLAGFALGFI